MFKALPLSSVALVERQRHGLRRYRVIPYHDLEPIIHFWIYERKSYRPVQSGRLGAASDLTDDLGLARYMVAVACDPTPLHLEADELLAQPLGVFEQVRPLPDKTLLLVEVHREGDAGFEGRGLCIELVAVEAHPRCEAKRVPGAESCRGGACLYQAAPDARGVASGKVDLEPVLPRVAGAGDETLRTVDHSFDEPEGLEARQIRFGEVLQEPCRLGSLQR